MAFKAQFRKNFSISEVVTRLVITILALYVGGTILTEVGKLVNCTSSPFNGGFTLLGYSVGSVNGSTCTTVNGVTAGATYYGNTVYSISNNSGILVIIGIVGIASIIMQFVKFKFN